MTRNIPLAFVYILERRIANEYGAVCCPTWRYLGVRIFPKVHM